jgi:hypothetical protein
MEIGLSEVFPYGILVHPVCFLTHSFRNSRIGEIRP